MKVMSRRSGQGMTEYIIIVAIIAIGAILIVGLFGKQIKGTFTGMGASLGGNDNKNQAVEVENTTAMENEGAVTETMSSFDENDQAGEEGEE